MPIIIDIKTSVNELRTMRHFEQRFYGTPDNYKPYASSRPQWTNDVVLATPQEIIESCGWDQIEESCEDCIAQNKTCVECSNPITYTATV